MERSAQSHAITTQIPLRCHEIKPQYFSVDGTPADCVMFACQRLLPRKPSWLLSGINRGGNLGDDVIYSGTVGAAVEGCLNGCRSMAISLEGPEPRRYDTAGEVVQRLLQAEHYFDLGERDILNVNIPSISFADIKGVAVTKLGRRIYEQKVRENFDPNGRPYYWIGGSMASFEDIPGSDCNLLNEGYVTLTMLRPDMYDAEATERLRGVVPPDLLKAQGLP